MILRVKAWRRNSKKLLKRMLSRLRVLFLSLISSEQRNKKIYRSSALTLYNHIRNASH